MQNEVYGCAFVFMVGWGICAAAVVLFVVGGVLLP